MRSLENGQCFLSGSEVLPRFVAARNMTVKQGAVVREQQRQVCCPETIVHCADERTESVVTDEVEHGSIVCWFEVMRGVHTNLRFVSRRFRRSPQIKTGVKSALSSASSAQSAGEEFMPSMF